MDSQSFKVTVEVTKIAKRSKRIKVGEAIILSFDEKTLGATLEPATQEELAQEISRYKLGMNVQYDFYDSALGSDNSLVIPIIKKVNVY